MHPVIAHLLANPQLRAGIERALAARGNRGDTMIAHLNPVEAAMLQRAGGSGSVNPRTGLRQFDPPGGSNAGGAGHAGDSGNNGGNGGGNAGDGNGGYSGQGRGFSGPAGGTMGGPYGGHLGGNTASGAQMGSAGAYATTGGLNVNPGRVLGGALGMGLGPLGGLLGGLVGGWASDKLGGNFNIGGTDNRIGASMGMGGSSGGWGGGQNNAGGNNGGQGQGNGMGGGSGNPAGPPGGSLPGGAVAPAGAPSGSGGGIMGNGITPALLALMSQASPNLFGNRFGNMPSWATQPYQIGTVPAVNRPPVIPGTPFA